MSHKSYIPPPPHAPRTLGPLSNCIYMQSYRPEIHIKIQSILSQTLLLLHLDQKTLKNRLFSLYRTPFLQSGPLPATLSSSFLLDALHSSSSPRNQRRDRDKAGDPSPCEGRAIEPKLFPVGAHRRGEMRGQFMVFDAI